MRRAVQARLSKPVTLNIAKQNLHAMALGGGNKLVQKLVNFVNTKNIFVNFLKIFLNSNELFETVQRKLLYSLLSSMWK